MAAWTDAVLEGSAVPGHSPGRAVSSGGKVSLPVCRYLGSVPSPQGDAAITGHVTARRASPKTGSGPFCS